MDYFEILSSKDSYEMDERHIYGELFIRIGDFFFPYADWGDLVASCLDMWLESAVNLCESFSGTQIVFYFMDGPHYFIAKIKSDKEVVLAFFSYEKLVNEFVVERVNFLHQIYSVAKQILHELYEKKEYEYHINKLNHYANLLKLHIF